MRVLVDTNVFVSHLLAGSRSTGPLGFIVGAAMRRSFELVLPSELLDELEVVLASKPYLKDRVTAHEAQGLMADLRLLADVLPPDTAPIPRIVRDLKDDYLLAAARRGRADVLVTGDRDLLALAGAVAPPRILSPADFAAELAASG